MRRLYVVVVLTGLALFSAVASGFAVFYVLLYVLIGALVASLAWSIANLAGVRVLAHRATGQARVGQFIEAELNIHNRSLLPKLLLEIRDMEQLPGQAVGTVVNLLPFQNFRWQVRAPLNKRGIYWLGPARARASDPFGLFSLQRTFPGAEEVTVYPATVDLHDFYLSVSDVAHQGTRYRQYQESAPSVSNIRDYNSGDSFQRIHWPSTARTRKLMVKQFENEMGNHVWIVLDMHRDVQAGGEIDNTEECGVTIAASIAEMFLSMGWPVGLMAHGDSRYLLTPQRNVTFHQDMLRTLAVARAEGTEPLAEVLRHSGGHFGSSSRLIVITPSTDPSWVQEVSNTSLQRSQLVAILIDAQSFQETRAPGVAPAAMQHAGILTYMVRQGDDLSVALDYRQAVSYPVTSDSDTPQ